MKEKLVKVIVISTGKKVELAESAARELVRMNAAAYAPDAKVRNRRLAQER